MNDFYETGVIIARDGTRRRLKPGEILQDGEAFRVSLMVMDGAPAVTPAAMTPEMQRGFEQAKAWNAQLEYERRVAEAYKAMK